MSEMENSLTCPNCEEYCTAAAVRCGRGARYFEENGIAFHRIHPDDNVNDESGRHRRHWDQYEEDEYERHERFRNEDERRPHRGPREHDGHNERGRREKEFRRGEFFHRHDAPGGESARYPELSPFADPEDNHDELEGMLIACARKLLSHHGRRFGSTQDRIVRILLENGGVMNQRTLQALLHIQPGSMSEILSKMEEKELITRKRNEGDRRAALITLNKNQEESGSPVPESEDRLAMLSDEEKTVLKSLLLKILKN